MEVRSALPRLHIMRGVGMGELASVAMSALDPFVGAMAASTCVRGTALAMGKTADELTSEDWPTLQASIRRLLGPIAPESVIAQIVSDIEQEVR